MGPNFLEPGEIAQRCCGQTAGAPWALRQEIGGFRRLARSALTNPWCAAAGAARRQRGVVCNCGLEKEARAKHSSQVSQPLQGGLELADLFAAVLVASMCIAQSSGMLASVLLFGSLRNGTFELLAIICAVAICIPIAVPAQPRKGSKQIKKMTNNKRIC